MNKKLNLAKKQIKRLIISFEDLAEAGSYTSQLLKHEYYEPYLKIEEHANTDEFIYMEALTTAIIVTYSRPFTDNKGKSTATNSLSKKCLRSYTPDEKKLHNKIVDRRNKSIAHSDADVYDVALSLNEYNGLVYPVFYNMPTIDYFSKEELLMIHKMIEKAHLYIDSEIHSMIQHHGDDFYRYIVKIGE